MRKHVGISTAIFFIGFLAFLAAGVECARAAEPDKQIVGWIEYITLLPENFKLKAKIDTGARHSSLHAANVVEFRRQGADFVRFDLTNWKGLTHTIEAKVRRIAKIKQHNSHPEHRLVIRLGICLGNRTRKVDVNLVNRSNFNYQMLIGRSFIKGAFVVDPDRTFTVRTDCQTGAQDE